MACGVLLTVFAVVLVLVEWRPKLSTGLGAAPGSTEQPGDLEPSPVKPFPEIQPQGSHNDLPAVPVDSDDAEATQATSEASQPTPIPPCAQDQPADRLPTGARIEPDGGAKGPSRLSIVNGTNRDAAVRLVDGATGRTVRFFYVEAGDTYTLSGIESGMYQLRYVSGYDWVPACQSFLREADYSEFEGELKFEALMPDEGRDGFRTTYTVTLNPVPLGTAKTRPIDRKRFFEGDQHIELTQ